jgi:hypothetical protein
MCGGLGNQMFQYALGRMLSIKNNTSLFMDISSFANDPLRDFTLHIFNIECNIFNSMADTPYVIKSSCVWYRNFINKILRKKIIQKVDEVKFGFNKDILACGDNIYLDGYWQSERYFCNIINILREDFQLREELSEKRKSIYKDIIKSNSISIHIRRSDYITNKAANVVHGVCELDWYKNAVSIITKDIADCIFYIFTDDPLWVKKNFNLDCCAVHVPLDADGRDFEDLFLMSACKHNIIANSSFSWWGAWLNANPDKIVIAPKRWFNDPNFDTSALFPNSWRSF